ncbi:leukocyte-associated immunoglobulin-like receptor 2 isoform X1 [Phyllostomus hastatus]|uniref:leukocyte-associated immunoglobulin-like receptor 2 isoform X1 n=1 Tax=Phyllostomus hastatus TaxID=9423 RepID=UPI001E682297|nr:leukocyte-associated immunoglobulin-like receptor 2 isoform X1 [Phyllostomus hastatus]
MQSLSITIQLYDLQAAGLAMESLPSLLLVLATLPVLCLTQTSHMQEEALPKPSIRAEPEPVILRGQPVTIVCRGPAWAELFRLVEKNRTSDYRDQRSKSQCGLQGTEARYCINAVNEFTAGSYWCHYLKGPRWSEPSEFLELKVADLASQNYTMGNYICIALSGVVLLILVAILAEAGHSWHSWPHPPQEWRQGS